jgi:membrane AbrB-like protein
MQPLRNYIQPLRNVAESFAVGAAGGAVFTLAGFPAGWIAGSMLFSAVAALAGRPILVPTWLARAFFIALGISIGAVATPETVVGMATWPISIMVICLAMMCIAAATAFYLTRVHGWDKQVAVLAGSPGALSQVMVLAAEYRLDLRGIAIVQTARVIMLAIGLPAGLALFGHVGPAQLAVGLPIAQAPGEFAVLVIGSTLLGLLLFRLGFSGGLIFGPMLVSAVLHGGGFVHVTLPPFVVYSAMVALGTIAGSRFTNTPFREVLSYLGAAIGSFAVAITVAAGFALITTTLLALPTAGVVIAYAPGSVDAMMVMALALQVDPVFVGAHHLTRVFLVSLAMPLVVRWAAPPGVTPLPPPRPKPRSDGIDD